MHSLDGSGVKASLSQKPGLAFPVYKQCSVRIVIPKYLTSHKVK